MGFIFFCSSVSAVFGMNINWKDNNNPKMKNMRKNTDEKLSFFKWISFFSDLLLTNTIYFVETVLRFFFINEFWCGAHVQFYFVNHFSNWFLIFLLFFFSCFFFSKKSPFNSFVIVDEHAFSPSVHRTQIVIANTIGILLCSMHAPF